MSFTTMDRFGGISVTYAHARGGSGAGGSVNSWWPDSFPGASDFSHQNKSHPTESMFDRIVRPRRWSTSERSPSAPEPLAPQFRHPAPAKEAIFHQSVPMLDRKREAHEFTVKQAALRRAELKQQRVDAYGLDAPINVPAAPSSASDRTIARSRSDSGCSIHSSVHASSISREVYEKHGFLVGRNGGSMADGKDGIMPRRHNPLSFHAMIFKGDLVGEGGSRNSRQSSRSRPPKPSKQWQTCPSNSFMLDPATSLPVPRGGSDSKSSGRESETVSAKYASKVALYDD